MTLRVEPAHNEDLIKIVPIIFDAYAGKHPYINAVFPNNLTEDGQEKALKRIIGIGASSETSQWEKVVDTATDQIIGAAMWLIYREKKPEAHHLDGPDGTWDSDADKEYAQQLYKSYAAEEQAFWNSNHLPLMSINAMVVLRKHQFRGAASLLMKSGLKMADEVGAACIVISTDEARWLYEKAGFVVDKHVTLPVPEKFADRPKVRFFYMHRDRRAPE
ncbi:hypothetical protein CC78DRAFT_594749 [Lojkania enalia]|uniref:N-acetyltransferase domain-containing protein n=1 Tax=Lojkania enalia TaxID=147567 RepID=A0A9P4KE49_9PLEO|nr:hypothetical protein CC78DRAFT_594749 [Didymosphaeria enalia]